jgi:CheY-like chemotaxis protein
MTGKILIVDDDIDTLRLVGLMLESEGFEIIAAKNGQRAISLAHSEIPDLIILDIMMPELDGYAVTKQLRQEGATRAIPILMFTAKTGLDDRVLGLELGADAFITKPISTRDLLTNVNNLLSPANREIDQTQTPKSTGMMAIMASKGGMGVTTLAINLAIGLNRNTEENVILSDFRPGLGSLALELGYTQNTGFNQLLDLPPEEINPQSVEEQLLDYSSGVRLLLSSPHPIDARLVSKIDAFETIASHLPQLANFVVLDLGPGMTSLNQKVLPHCSDVLLITEPSPQSIFQTKELIGEFFQMGFKTEQINLIVFNRVPSSVQLSFGEIEDQLNLTIVSAFSPNPELAYRASIENEPIIVSKPEGLTAQQFKQLAIDVIQGS